MQMINPLVKTQHKRAICYFRHQLQILCGKGQLAPWPGLPYQLQHPNAVICYQVFNGKIDIDR